MDVKQLYEYANGLFEKKSLLNALHQEIAEQFYPERADFTLRRELGDEFASHLISSYPVLTRRDLADQIGTMLRPVGKPWFSIIPVDTDRDTENSRRWLENATHIQRRAMYDPATLFSRAVKEGDNDFVTFGQCVISADIAWDDEAEGPHLLHRCWHLRDMAWTEDKYGKVGSRFRRWKPTAQLLNSLFPGKTHPSVQRLATGTGRKPQTEVECLHMVVEAELYHSPGKKKRRKDQKWVSIYYDCQNKHIIEETNTWNFRYVIPRWQTVSGSQYAYSPSTIVALPDARLIQAIGRTLLEAGEKITNPPMIATDEVVRSDIAIYPGGITWVDRDYDERLGEALRPMTIDAGGMPIGLDILQDTRQILYSAFYLNKLTMPQRAPEMTAYEVSQRIQQYIRDALPIFEPMEMDYNGQLCELDFELLRRGGAFGSPQEMPQELSDAKISFRFASPLHEAVESEKTQKFIEMRTLLAEAAQMDQTTLAIPDAIVAFRDALQSAGIPQKWIRSETTVRQIKEATEAQQEALQLLETMKTGSEVTKNIASASKDAGGGSVLAP